jgi:hypothetical protein
MYMYTTLSMDLASPSAVNNAVLKAREEAQSLVSVLTVRHHQQYTAALNHADIAVSAGSWTQEASEVATSWRPISPDVSMPDGAACSCPRQIRSPPLEEYCIVRFMQASNRCALPVDHASCMLQGLCGHRQLPRNTRYSAHEHPILRFAAAAVKIT